jgi:hypothetical protein
MNREYFFTRVRRSVFGGRLSVSQADGMTRILDYREEHWPKMPDEELAYCLATVVHETGHRMVPVREGGGERYLRSKRYYPWVGEGLVQVTWEANARKFGATKPGDCMSWPVALRALFEGMIKGMFTGKKLSDYIGPENHNYVQARRIINGMDKAHLVAGYAEAFLLALKKAREAPMDAIASPDKPEPTSA